MPKEQLVVRFRRKFWLFSLLIFLAGLVIGLLIGMYGIRYFFFRFPPTVEDMVKRTASRIDKDFSLDDESRKNLERELGKLIGAIHETFGENRKRTDELMKQSVESIAATLPENKREKWRKNYRDYFPKGPPPPPPPPRNAP